MIETLMVDMLRDVSPTRSGKRRIGFSLVEVLVVIAIIVVLAGILLPVTASARKSAKITVTESNLHQLYVANALYAEDRDGILCPYPTTIQNVVTYWAKVSGSYHGEFPQYHLSELDPYVKAQDIWYSPGDLFRGKDGWPAIPDFNVPHNITSYAYEPFLVGDALRQWLSTRPEPLLMRCAIDSPDDVVSPTLIQEPIARMADPKESRNYWGDRVRREINRRGTLVRTRE